MCPEPTVFKKQDVQAQIQDKGKSSVITMKIFNHRKLFYFDHTNPTFLGAETNEKLSDLTSFFGTQNHAHSLKQHQQDKTYHDFRTLEGLRQCINTTKSVI